MSFCVKSPGHPARGFFFPYSAQPSARLWLDLDEATMLKEIGSVAHIPEYIARQGRG
jgi:hypothetical protein